MFCVSLRVAADWRDTVVLSRPLHPPFLRRAVAAADVHDTIMGFHQSRSSFYCGGCTSITRSVSCDSQSHDTLSNITGRHLVWWYFQLKHLAPRDLIKIHSCNISSFLYLLCGCCCIKPYMWSGNVRVLCDKYLSTACVCVWYDFKEWLCDSTVVCAMQRTQRNHGTCVTTQHWAAARVDWNPLHQQIAFQTHWSLKERRRFDGHFSPADVQLLFFSFFFLFSEKTSAFQPRMILNVTH